MHQQTEQQRFYPAPFNKNKQHDPAYPRSETLNTPIAATTLATPLGNMMVIADDTALFLLEFIDRKEIERKIEKLQRLLKTTITSGKTKPMQLIENELRDYFTGNRTIFKTPIHLIGSDFQKQAWQQLLKIPYGQTQSYAKQAEAIKNPCACRAVANANGANPLTIIVPCHRIIQSNGHLGGYGGGVQRKEWLIEHEKKYATRAK